MGIICRSGQSPPEVPTGALVRTDQQADTQSDTHTNAKADSNSDTDTGIKPWKLTVLTLYKVLPWVQTVIVNIHIRLWFGILEFWYLKQVTGKISMLSYVSDINHKCLALYIGYIRFKQLKECIPWTGPQLCKLMCWMLNIHEYSERLLNAVKNSS